MKNLIIGNEELPISEPITIPGDKSISHRVLMLAILFDNETTITNLNMGSAVTILKDLYRLLKIPIELSSAKEAKVGYFDPSRIAQEQVVLNAGGSSCVARFFIGIMAGLGVNCIIDGNETLRNRPMDFVVEPLHELGANIQYLDKEGCLPVKIGKGSMKDGSVHLKVDSAQASSAVFLAAITAKIKVEVHYKSHSRDHTQKLLHYLGCDYFKDGTRYILNGRKPLQPLLSYRVPGDPSLAAFPIAGHLLQRKTQPLVIEKICINPTRTGILEVFKEMGADIQYQNLQNYFGEETGDIVVAPLQHTLRPLHIQGGALLQAMLDEVPLAAAVSATLKGQTVISDAQELEFKETNRLLTTKDMLNSFGIQASLKPGGLIIEGTSHIEGTFVDSHKDHRISMAASILALKSPKPVEIIDGSCYETSFPDFATEMRKAGFAMYDTESVIKTT